MTHIKRVFSAWGAPALGLFIAGSGSSQTVLSNQYYEVTSLSGATVEMYGRSELHITGSNTPISGCTINMRPMDSWVFLHAVKPSAASSLLGQFRVNGLNAVLNSNVQVVQYGQGAVVIPYPSGFQPMTVYDSENFSGASMNLTPYTQYGTSQLGSMASKVSSFTLKRGYTATVAQNTDGTGASVNYVAADGDLEIGALPDELNDQVNFVRIFPWRWTSKKGIAGNIGSQLNVQWWYNWNIDQNSTLDKEYVPIRQQRWWPSLNQNWQTRGASHLLGYNEPNHTDQANMTVGDAIGSWPDLLGTGLRVGSPAPADDGRSWLYSFMSQADAADLRVDFVAVHYYWCYNPADPAGAANQMYDYLLDVYHHTHKPIWITEWNNGANWTGCGDPTHAQQAACISAMVDMLDNTPWVERYAPYNWVEDVRRLEWNDGYPTDAGLVYRDQPSPIGYRQAMKQNRSRGASYYFENSCLDDSGGGNHGTAVNVPVYTTGRHGQAIQLDGANSYVQLPGDIADSSSFTFAAWVYWNGGAGNQRIFDFGNFDLTQYMVLTPSYGGKLSFALRNGGSTSWVSAPSALTSGSWQHVAVTVSGSAVKLYLNGASQTLTGSISGVSALSGTLYNYLGKSQWSTDPLFSGTLDDVHIFDHALSQPEIAALMNTQPPQAFTPLVDGGTASQGVGYSGSVTGAAIDPDGGGVTYGKVYGPSWLVVGADGSLSGTPGYESEGAQYFTVRATDIAGAHCYFMLTIDLPSILFDGIWTADGDGLWSTPAQWNSGHIANGAGNTADFSTLNILADRTVTLDSPRRIGTLKLGDTSGSQTWTLASGGGVLTLDSGSSASPSIMINNSTATLGVSLAGTNGFTKSGAGILVLAGANSLSGTVNIDTSAASGNGGAVRASYSSSLAAVDTVQIRNNNSGYSTLQFDGTQHGDVVVPAGVVLSGRNVNVAAIQNMGGNNVLSGGINIGVGGGYYVIQSDAGMLELGGTITSAATGTRTFTFQGTGDGLVSGRIENGSADAVNVVKSGAGKWTLAGTETYTGTTTVSGGELMVNGTTGAGATTVASGATLSGGGTVNSNLTAQTGCRIRIGGQGFPLGPDTAFALIDSFQSYPFGANGTTLTPAWVPGFPAGGANSSSTQIGADTGSGQALRYLHGGSGGQINYAAMGTIAAEGSTGTLFFQVALTATGSDTLFAFGRPGAAAYGDLASLFRVPSDLIVEVHDAGYVNTSTSISLNTLYNFWVVIDNRANTSSLYYSTGTNAPTLIQSGYAFRSSTAGDINTFYLGSNSGSAGFLDNIHIDPTGDNRTNPLDVTEMAPRAATLHVANDFTLSSGTTLEFDVSSSDLYDRLVVGGQFNASGTLKVTFDPEQPAPWSGDTFDLFDSAGGTINFATLDLPALAPGLAWDTNSVGSGVLNVVQSVATHPTNLVPFVSNNVLTLSWPKDHTGWRLETQTNSPGAGISTHWMTVPGSDLTNEMSLPINPANGSAFFRLVHP